MRKIFPVVMEHFYYEKNFVGQIPPKCVEYAGLVDFNFELKKKKSVCFCGKRTLNIFRQSI